MDDLSSKNTTPVDFFPKVLQTEGIFIYNSIKTNEKDMATLKIIAYAIQLNQLLKIVTISKEIRWRKINLEQQKTWAILN